MEDLDLRQRRPLGLLLHLRVEGAQASEVAVQLLGVEREEEGIEQLGGVLVRRLLEDRGVADGKRCALGRIDDLDRHPALLQGEYVVLVAVALEVAPALGRLIRRLGGQLARLPVLWSRGIETGERRLVERGGGEGE